MLFCDPIPADRQDFGGVNDAVARVGSLNNPGGVGGDVVADCILPNRLWGGWVAQPLFGATCETDTNHVQPVSTTHRGQQ